MEGLTSLFQTGGLASAVFAFITGGGALAFLTWLFKQARAPADDWREITVERNGEIARLREEIVQLRAEMASMREALTETHEQFLKVINERDEAVARVETLEREIEQMRLGQKAGGRE